MSGVLRWGFTLLGVTLLLILWIVLERGAQGDVRADQSEAADLLWNGGEPLGVKMVTVRLQARSQEERKETISPVRKQVALTFDDGPDGTYTPQILDILKREGVPATFFVLGSGVRGYPDIVRRMEAEGHVVANHTWSHPDLTRLNEKQIKKELTATNRAVKQAIGKEMRLMRPPYGAIRGKENVVEQAGWYSVMWDVDPRDWQSGKTPGEIRRSVRERVQPSSIILLHSSGGDREATVRALPGIIRDLRRSGYQLVTVDVIVGIPPYHH